MLNPEKFTDKITDSLYDSMEIIEIIYDKHRMPITDQEKTELKETNIPTSLIVLYCKTDGLHIKWCSKETDTVGGELKFNEHIWLLRNDQSLIDQCDMDPNMDERLRHFRVWDVPTMNTMVGFFHDSETGFSKSLYFYTQGASYAKSLDLDVDGYLNMAFESAAFYYWQQVILDIKNETESPETRKFKEWMPKLFPDFSWEAFVEKYLELRLK